MIFLIILFSKLLDIKKIKRTSISSTVMWSAIRVYSGVANLASKYDNSNPLIFRDMAFLCFFFKFFFKKLRY